MSSNHTAFLDGKGERLRVQTSSIPEAEAGRVVIRNKAIAINPVDWKIQDTGFFVQQWPFVLGEDAAGEIVEVAKDVKNFKVGDRVLAHADNLVTQKPEHGAFNEYWSPQASWTAKIPDHVSFTEASVLPLAFDTAACGLYLPTSDGFLGLDFPSLDPKPSGKVIVVWGGSSSVGAVTIQLAVASGANVIATASPHNFEFCKKLGASRVFDYRSSKIVDDLVNAVKASGHKFAGVYDAIATEDQSLEKAIAVTEHLGGGSLATVLPPPKNLPSNVKGGNIFAVNPIPRPLWTDYLPQALEQGKLRCVPEPFVVGKGLESLQKGCDENKKGVSAKKVVIEL